MQKFNLLHNADGSFSYFRAGCLFIVALCMVAFAPLRHERPQAQAEYEAASAEQAQDAPTSALDAVFESKEEQQAQLRLKRRQEALTELDDGRHFLTTCGNINAGFEGCRFEFSPEVLQFYDAQVEAADDGFSLLLTAKGEQAADLCVQLGADSQGEIYALDKQGKRRNECVPDKLRQPDLTTLHRRTDEVLPNAAPSGRQPLLIRTAERTLPEDAVADHSLQTYNRKI